MGSVEPEVITREEAATIFEAKIDITDKITRHDSRALRMLAIAQATYDGPIESIEVCQCVTDEIGEAKRLIKALNEERLSETRDLDEVKRKIMARYQRAIGPLEQIVALLQPKATAFLEAQEAARKAEERRQAEERRREQERLAREAAEAKRVADEAAEAERKRAAEARQQAEAAAREQERQAAEARRQGEAQAAAEAEARAKEVREQANRDAAVAVERAAQIKEEGERTAEALQQTAAVLPAPIVAETKLAGAHVSGRWGAEVDTDMADPFMAAMKHCVAHPEDATAVFQWNQTGQNQLAAARKERFNIPGLKARFKPSLTNRGKRG